MRGRWALQAAAVGAIALALGGCTIEELTIESVGSEPVYAPSDYTAGYTAFEPADPYAGIDRADALWEAIGQAPPDFAFAFEGREPWAWETEDGHRIVVEDLGDDGIRSYYFAPGSATPFLAVEPGASFAFEGTRVAVVYGPDGTALPREEGRRWLGEAGAMYARARALSDAMTGRRDVDAATWVDSSWFVLSFVREWDSGWRRNPGWRAHREGTAGAEWRRRLERERAHRRDQSESFGRWRQGGFQGAPAGRWQRPGATPEAGRPPQPGRHREWQGTRNDRPDRPDRPQGATPQRDWRGPGPAGPQPRPQAPRKHIEGDQAELPADGGPATTPAPAPERPRRSWQGRSESSAPGAETPSRSRESYRQRSESQPQASSPQPRAEPSPPPPRREPPMRASKTKTDDLPPD